MRQTTECWQKKQKDKQGCQTNEETQRACALLLSKPAVASASMLPLRPLTCMCACVQTVYSEVVSLLSLPAPRGGAGTTQLETSNCVRKPAFILRLCVCITPCIQELPSFLLLLEWIIQRMTEIISLHEGRQPRQPRLC